MELSLTGIKFLKENIKLIDEYKFDKLYEELNDNFILEVVGKFTEWFFENEIYPHEYMEVIPEGYLSGNKSINEFTIPSNILSVYKNSCSYSNISTIKIEEGCKFIGKYAFYNCLELETIYLPSTIGYLDNYVFWKSTKIKNIYYNGRADDFISLIKDNTFDGNINFTIHCTDCDLFYNKSELHKR